jgi:membrane protease YdiL (CAAX protease family)
MINEQGIPESSISDSKPALNPFRVSVYLLVYYFAVYLVMDRLLEIPGFAGYLRDPLIALILQVSYGLGGVVLAFWLSGQVKLLTWFAQCGLVRSNRWFIMHGFIVGAGLHMIPRVIAGDAIYFFDNRNPLFLVVIGIVNPLMEDIVFQGFLYSLFRRRYGVRSSIIIVAFFASLAHGWNIDYHLYSIFLLVFGEAVFCVYREYTGALWPATACHVGANLSAFLGK